MSFLRPFRPLALSFFGLSLPTTRQSSSSSASTCTRYLWRQPSPAAPRESPFPLVFVRARGVPSNSLAAGLDEVPEETWADWSGMFAEKGYTGIEIDIQAPTSMENATTKSILDSMTTMLASQIRLMAIPFAPIIISSGASSTMLTQNYISSHPASGLVIVNPLEGKEADEMFDFEPSFPILVVNEEGSSKGRLGRAAEQGTGRGGKGVEVEQLVDGVRGERSRVSKGGWTGVGSDASRSQSRQSGLTSICDPPSPLVVYELVGVSEIKVIEEQAKAKLRFPQVGFSCEGGWILSTSSLGIFDKGRRLQSWLDQTDKAWTAITHVKGPVDQFIVVPHGTFDEFGVQPEDTCAYIATMSLDMLSATPSEAISIAQTHIQGVHQNAPVPSLDTWTLAETPYVDSAGTQRSLILVSQSHDSQRLEGRFVLDDEDGASYFTMRLLYNPLTRMNHVDHAPEAPVDSVRCYMTSEQAWEMSEAIRRGYMEGQSTTSDVPSIAADNISGTERAESHDDEGHQ